MKNASKFAIVLLFMTLAMLACSLSAPTEAVPQVDGDATTDPNVGPAPAIQVPSKTPTTAQLQLEIVQSQAWADRDGNVRTNVLVRNPYDFPVAFRGSPFANLLKSGGELMLSDELYFLDGISGGTGFILPGEEIAATACFTCERPLLTEEWDSVGFMFFIEDATDKWDYSTEVEASVGDVSFDGDSPIFDVSGTVKNNSDSALDRISVRVFVFDQEGNLVGAAETSAWDVGAGATVIFDGYGIGQAPDGPVVYEVNALGVNY